MPTHLFQKENLRLKRSLRVLGASSTLDHQKARLVQMKTSSSEGRRLLLKKRRSGRAMDSSSRQARLNQVAEQRQKLIEEQKRFEEAQAKFLEEQRALLAEEQRLDEARKDVLVQLLNDDNTGQAASPVTKAYQ